MSVALPVEVSATVSNKAPKQNSTIYLTETGPAKAKVTAVCSYKTTKTTYHGTIASNGEAVVPIKIGRAVRNYKVVVNVTVLYNGKSYKAQTYFIPR
ncbi:MAG: hypothetical protein JG770_1913 [Mahella sp.]|nr:hypothetical protein [Mahella sp.]MDK2902644.1 hypothetical protein [Clostridiales bacterium]